MHARIRSLRNALASAIVATAAIGAGWAAAPARADEPAFTSDFRIEECEFDDEGENPLYPLEAGVFQRLEGESDGEEVVVEIRVLAKTRKVALEIGGRRRWVRTRVVKETEWIDGELAEIAYNYVAVCEPRNDVFYFGEEVFNYEDGEVVNMDGSWLAGQGGATPGILMPGTFLLGSRYQQEVAPGVAEDRGENVAMGLEVDVEAGHFERCVQVLDTNPLDPGSEGDLKTYCPGIGLTIDEEVELTEFRGLDEDDDDHDD
jgi:hypothetical protein